MPRQRPPAPRLSALAERDLVEILVWTNARFGPEQTKIYRDVLLAAVRRLREGPDVAGARRRDELMAGLWSLHVARAGHRGRHVLFYRVGDAGRIEILRILHDAMDFRRHFAT